MRIYHHPQQWKVTGALGKGWREQKPTWDVFKKRQKDGREGIKTIILGSLVVRGNRHGVSRLI